MTWAEILKAPKSFGALRVLEKLLNDLQQVQTVQLGVFAVLYCGD